MAREQPPTRTFDRSQSYTSPGSSPQVPGNAGKNRQARFHSAPSAANASVSTPPPAPTEGSQKGTPNSVPLADLDFMDANCEGSPSGAHYGGVLHSHSHSTPSPWCPPLPLPSLEDQCFRSQAPLQLQQLQQQMAPYAQPVPTLPRDLALADPSIATAGGLGLLWGDRTSGSKFRADMLTARSSTHAMDRYKALTRLCCALCRELASAQLSDPLDAAAWNQPEHMELLWKIYEVGEALAMFGTADFNERTNSSRAITNKDYAYLLKRFGEEFWGLFKPGFIDGLPQALQDDATAVRGLLITRFESNAIIGDQLMQNVGKEQLGQQGGGTVSVFNTSSISANPVNTVSSNTKARIHNSVAAASKLLQQSGRLGKVPAVLLGSIASGWILRRMGLLGLVGLAGRGSKGGRSNCRGRNVLCSEDEGDQGGTSSRGSRRSLQARRELDSDERLLLAFDHADTVYKELQKAEQNGELLKNDWRLGTIRLAAPFGGPYPPGYQPINTDACEPRVFMHKQMGIL
mmetsp:Transcript_9514/g.25665  ORF Transcript_9514/g.25665 Transcript_9514/m.25665 type:complete len:517 (+) Transcript_9514:115-1665(+)